MNNIKEASNYTGLSGIYKIINLTTGRFYIGQSKDLNARLKSHLRMLRQNKSRNVILQNAFNKYGEKDFVFEVLELINYDKIELDNLEQYYINYLTPYYNICKIVNSPSSGLTKEERSKIAIKNWQSSEYRNKVMKAKEWYYKSDTTEIHKKCAEGRKLFWKNASEEYKTNVKAKISKGNKGKIISEAHKELLRNKTKGKKLSNETKVKISEALRRRVRKTKRIKVEYRDGRTIEYLTISAIIKNELVSSKSIFKSINNNCWVSKNSRKFTLLEEY